MFDDREHFTEINLLLLSLLLLLFIIIIIIIFIIDIIIYDGKKFRADIIK